MMALLSGNSGYLRIVFPRKIKDLYIDIHEKQKFKRTHEDVKWECIAYLKDSRSCETCSQENAAEAEINDHIVDLLPAFGFLAENESVWLPSCHIFKKTDKQQVYKFRIRHRPSQKQAYIKDSLTLLSEYFLLQALDDFLFGSLGKNTDVPDESLLQLVTLALLFPSSLPLDNSLIIDDTYKVRKFQLWNFPKLFSREIFNRLIDSKNWFIRKIDQYHFWNVIKESFQGYKSVNKKKTLKDYKETFLKLILENYPWYCYEQFSVQQKTASGYITAVDFSINVYAETSDQEAGVYINGEKSYCLEDIDELELKKPTAACKEWQVVIVSHTNSLMFHDKTLVFPSEEKAQSFISMMQGYTTLCVQANKILCLEMVDRFTRAREDLKSFCPLSHREALAKLQDDNQLKQENYKSNFIVYQSRKTLGLFHLVVEPGQFVPIREFNRSASLSEPTKCTPVLEPGQFGPIPELAECRQVVDESNQLGPCLPNAEPPGHFVHAVDPIRPVCDIECMDSGAFLLTTHWTVDGCDKSNQEFGNVKLLRQELLNKYGQQMHSNSKNDGSIREDSVFYVQKLIETYDEEEELALVRSKYFVIEDDIEPVCKNKGSGRPEYVAVSQNDPHLQGILVKVKETEEKRVQLTLAQRNKEFLKALYEGVTRIAKLGRTNPGVIVEFYGPLITPDIWPSFLFEHTGSGNLLEFINLRNQMTIQEKMNFALQVVKIFFSLTQSIQTADPTYHGNLRANAFYVFTNPSSGTTSLKLGHPGLVYHSDQFPIYQQDNSHPTNPQHPDNLKRLLWLSPERRYNLSEVTTASECYAVATTVAEIFYETDDFRSKLNPTLTNEQFVSYWKDTNNLIPTPPAPELEDQALMPQVCSLIGDVWQTLESCWRERPEERPLPVDLQKTFRGFHDKAKSIPQETVLEHVSVKLQTLYSLPQKPTTISDCHQVLKRNQPSFLGPREFTLGGKLGGGSFGEVMKGTLLRDQRPIAVKFMKGDGNNLTQTFMKEIEVSTNLKHPHIVDSLYWSHFVYPGGSSLCIIMEQMNSGVLLGFVKKEPLKTKQEPEKRKEVIQRLLKLCLDVAKGMAYLEKNLVVHGDLAARNVLLHHTGTDLVAKVSDFGLTKILGQEQTYYYTQSLPEKLPILWYPPEYLLRERNGQYSNGIPFSSPGDVWAYGTTLWEVFHMGASPSSVLVQCGLPQSNRLNMQILYDFYITQQGRWPRAPYVDAPIYRLMESCWKESQEARPTFAKLMELVQNLHECYNQQA